MKRLISTQRINQTVNSGNSNEKEDQSYFDRMAFPSFISVLTQWTDYFGPFYAQKENETNKWKCRSEDGGWKPFEKVNTFFFWFEIWRRRRFVSDEALTNKTVAPSNSLGIAWLNIAPPTRNTTRTRKKASSIIKFTDWLCIQHFHKMIWYDASIRIGR